MADDQPPSAAASRLGRLDLPLPPHLVAAAAVATSAFTVLAVENPAIGIGVLLALLLALAIWSYPEISLVALLAIVPFNGAILTALTHNAGAHVGRLGDWKDALIVLLFVRGVIARRRREHALTVPHGPFPRYLVAYVLFYCVLALASPALTPAATALSRDVEGPLLFLALICLRPSQRVLRACLFALLAGAAVMALAAVYEKLGPHDGFITWYGAPKPPRLSSFYGASGHYRAGSFLDSPLTLAFYLAVCAPVAVGVAFALRQWRLAAPVIAAACVAGIIMSGTRSGYIGAGIGLALVLGLALTNGAVRTALVGIFLIAVALAYVTNQNNPQLTRTGENASKQGAITSTFDYIAAHPFGAGLGTIDAVGQKFANDSGGSRISSESTLLAKGYEGGVAALFLYPATMLLLIVYLAGQRRSAAARGDPVPVALGAGAIGAVGAVLGAGLFLGVQELVVEIVIWGAAGIAAAWPLADTAGFAAASPVAGAPGAGAGAAAVDC
jgi:hypothetical protein